MIKDITVINTIKTGRLTRRKIDYIKIRKGRMTQSPKVVHDHSEKKKRLID